MRWLHVYLPATEGRRVSAVTNVSVKLLFNYRREDFAYYAIFRSALETTTTAARVVVVVATAEGRNSSEIFYFLRAADPRPLRQRVQRLF